MRWRIGLGVVWWWLAAACSTAEVAGLRFDSGLAEGKPAADGAVPEDAAGLTVTYRSKAPSRLGSGGWDDAEIADKAAPSDPAGEAAAAPEPSVGERMRIYSGGITVEVARRDDAAAQFLAKVKEWGGYLSQQQDDQLVVRVPAAQFEPAFVWLRTLGLVRSESKRTEDVTDQYLDLGIRLENAKKSRARLLELLAKADKVEDMLKIEEQLRRLTEEIERFEGQLKRLQDQVALATISVRFVAPAAAPDRPGGRPSRFAWIRAIGVERMEGF